MQRRNTFKVFEEMPKRGPFDEFPMLKSGIDPQLCLSRNDRPQPFFLICEQDTLVAQMSGKARIEFKNSAANYFDMVPGDYVYVPGGTPSRIIPDGVSINLRYKPEHPGLEAVAWYDAEGRETRETFDTATELPQEAYLRICTAFNVSAQMRLGLPLIDLSPFRWKEIAAEIRDALASEASKAKAGELTTPQRHAGRIEIPPPRADKIPLKANVYQFGLVAMVPLTIMFPYLDPGSMVPCIQASLHSGGPAGFYVHQNDVDEVYLCWGAQDSYMAPGLVRVGPRTHSVGRRPGMGDDHAGTVIAIITQRQAVSGDQREAVSFVCEKCNAELFRHDFDALKPTPELAPLLGELDLAYIGCPTQVHGSVAMMRYVRDESLRTCKKCGHVNQEFPYRMWGVDRHNPRIAGVLGLRQSLIEAASKPDADQRA
jgi:3-hydroxyanthranilate 3,4-dioxygenase